jgi:type I restriction enzyme S subunit
MMEDMNNLPTLPKGWVWTRVEEIVSNVPITGKKLKQSEYEVTGKLPVIDQGQKFVGGYTDAVGLRVDVELPVIVFGDHTKAVKFVNFDFVAGADGIKVIKPHEVFDPKLFYYFLQAIELPEKGYARHFQFLQRSFIPLPRFPEQHRIVSKIEELFTKIDAGIEALKKVKAQLTRYRQAVLKYAFEGKLTEEWRKENKDKIEPAFELLERIKEERRKKAKGKFSELAPADTSDLRELPDGWLWTRVGEVADNIHYGYTESATEEKIGPKFLRITDIQNNEVNWDLVPYCRIDDEEKGKYLLKEGDLVFARTGATVGKSFLIAGKIPESVFASYLIRIIINNNINNRYVCCFFQSIDYWMQISEGKLGIGQPNVNAQVLSRIRFPLPSLAEQNKIVEEIERCFSVADEVERVVEQSLRQAQRLRQSILKKAFQGKLVPQDPSDEPAEKLLERIKQEKAEQEAENRKKKTRNRTNVKQGRLI